MLTMTPSPGEMTVRASADADQAEIVLGAIAGVTVALSLPSASHEVDEAHLDAVTGAYRSTLVELLRQAWDARRAGMN